jgi:hypothetical protein
MLGQAYLLQFESSKLTWMPSDRSEKNYFVYSLFKLVKMALRGIIPNLDSHTAILISAHNLDIVIPCISQRWRVKYHVE